MHHKQNMLNFIGGKVRDLEDPIEASYRELLEETGISRSDVELKFVRRESVTSVAMPREWGVWSMYVTAGVLKDDMQLPLKEDSLRWIPLADFNSMVMDMFGHGNCLNYLLESASVLGVKI